VIGPAVPVLYRNRWGPSAHGAFGIIEERAGRLEGQPARTREVKLGCVFTQTTTDEQDRPVRDEGSTLAEPQSADPMRRERSCLDPAVDSVPGDAEVRSDLVDRRHRSAESGLLPASLCMNR
jgi:hypothetical protein